MPKHILLFIYLCCTISGTAQTTELKWRFTDPRDGKVYDLGTKGSIQEGLIRNGLLPDPFDQENEKLFLWVEDYKWTCESRFFLTEEQHEAKYLELEFPSIDTYAEVYLNDSLIMRTENAFKPYYEDIKPLVRLGYNYLRVVFTPPVIYHRAQYDTMRYHLPAINDVHEIAVAPMVRKPQYQFGWDWALRINTMGFNKPALLHVVNTNRVVTKNVQTIELGEHNAILLLSVNLSENEPMEEDLFWVSEIFGTQRVKPVTSRSVHREVLMQNPKLWWPRGHGKPNLYNDHWMIMRGDGSRVAELDVQFGVRKSELVRAEDKWGTSYEIHVNNKPIFCKGGDYIPQDIFLARITSEERKEMVRLMDESNFNMVRVWGGGMYAEDDFLAECDRRGIMVWHDLMFACSIYPGDSAFLANVKGELEYQVPRIAGHASVVLFNGNNEVDVAWKNWGFQIRYGIHGKDAREVEENYDKLFRQLAPQTISRFAVTPYIHTSPLSNWGKKEYYDHGSQHYWGVWHGKDPIEDFSKKIGRFNAEYGFESFPEFSTLLAFSRHEQWNLDSSVMKHHQKSYVGNGMIEKHAKRLYGNMPDFETFVYYSQLTQAKAVGIAVAGHRVNAPRCMGTLYWQVNDCWPAPSWSSVDYFHNWKALQYEIKKDYENVAVVQQINELNKEVYYLVSDLDTTLNTRVNAIIYDFKGRELKTESFDVALEPLKAVKLFEATEAFRHRDNFVVRFEWENEQHQSRTRIFVHEPRSYREAEADDIEVSIDRIDTVNQVAFVRVTNKRFVNDFWLSSKKAGMQFSDNFIPLIPGEHTILVYYKEIPVLEDFIWMWR